MAKKHANAELWSLTVNCGYCNKASVFLTTEIERNVRFAGWSQDCETCGSHCGVTISFTCPECKKRNDIDVGDY